MTNAQVKAGFTVVSWNIEGISNTIRQLDSEEKLLLKQADVICLSETCMKQL